MTLTGTQKQIAWAEDIRREALENYRRIANERENIVDEVALETAVDQVTAARDWIDNRSTTLRLLSNRIDRWVSAANAIEDEDEADAEYERRERIANRFHRAVR